MSDYPKIKLTDGSTLAPNYPKGSFGIADAKRFFEAWRNYIVFNRGDEIPKIHTIKLIREVYAFAYALGARQNAPTKTYTAKDMHNAYLYGMRAGGKLLVNAFDAAAAEAFALYQQERKAQETASNEVLEAAADTILHTNLDKPCDCPNCQAEKSNPHKTVDDLLEMFKPIKTDGGKRFDL